MSDPAADRNPDDVRAEIRRTNAAARALLSAMRMQFPDTELPSAFDDRGLAAAFDAYEREADPLGLPDAAAITAAGMSPSSAGAAVEAAADTAVQAWRFRGDADPLTRPDEMDAEAVNRIRGGVELAVQAIARGAASVLSEAGRLELVARLDAWLSTHGWVRPGDEHYEDRLRRAGCMMVLGQIEADIEMYGLGHELARREKRCRPWLPTAHVVDRAYTFIGDQLGPNPSAAAVIDLLRAELALLADVPYLPAEPDDGPADA